MEPNLFDVAQGVLREERDKIRLAKIEEIRRAWDDLFFIVLGEEVYTGSVDYTSFEKNMRMAFEKTRQRERDPIETCQITPSGALLKQLGELMSVDYTPPQTGEGIADDLILLRKYYRSNFFFHSVEMALDLSLCKLIGAVNKLCAIAIQRGKRDLKRTKESTKTKKEQMKITAKQIKDTFYGLQFLKMAFPKGVSLNKVAGMIYIKLNRVYCIDTIKRVLKKDEEVFKQFTETTIKGKKSYIKQV